MKRTFATAIALALSLWFAAGSYAADDAAAKRRKDWIERQKALQLRGILKLDSFMVTGDPSKRVDIVMLSDGFLREDLDEFTALSEKIGKQLLYMQPFENFKNYINYHRLYIESQPDAPVLGSEVDDARILTCDATKAFSFAKYAPDCDLVLVISKTRKRARSTAQGILVTLCSKGGVTDTTVHEFGHALGDLADEYVEEAGGGFSLRPIPTAEPSQVNVTLESVPMLSKWHYWVYPPVSRHEVKNREGAMYVEKDVYRPENSCMMRCDSNRFCVVCLEKMILSFYERVPPIETQQPAQVHVQVYEDEPLEFRAEALKYTPGRYANASCAKIDWRWYLDNEPMRSKFEKSFGTIYEVDPKDVEPGIHELVVTCDIHDTRVRRDKGLMSDARYWIVEVLPYPRPKFDAPDSEKVQAGQEVTFTVKFKDLEKGKYKLKAVGLPAGATFDPDTGDFAWKTKESQAGAYLVDFVADNGKFQEKASTVIAVGDGDNQQPEFVDAFDENGIEGEPFDVAFKAEDPDGDHLLFDIKGLPPEAKLDRRTGEIDWMPGYSDFGKYYTTATVTDGSKTGVAKIIFNVYNSQMTTEMLKKVFTDTPDQTFEFCTALRSPITDYRSTAFAKLAKAPAAFRAALTARLLRDGEDRLKDEARKVAYAEKNNPQFMGPFFREMAEKVWQFTDDPDTLTMLAALAKEHAADDWDPIFSKSVEYIDQRLAKAEKYNTYRDKLREKSHAEDW